VFDDGEGAAINGQTRFGRKAYLQKINRISVLVKNQALKRFRKKNLFELKFCPIKPKNSGFI
jgi:hypothetical protein